MSAKKRKAIVSWLKRADPPVVGLVYRVCCAIVAAQGKDGVTGTMLEGEVAGRKKKIVVIIASGLAADHFNDEALRLTGKRADEMMGEGPGL
jgi:hypothetical protein